MESGTAMQGGTQDALASLARAALGGAADWATALRRCADCTDASRLLLACHTPLDPEPLLVLGCGDDLDRALVRRALAIDPRVRSGRAPADTTGWVPWSALVDGRTCLGAGLLDPGTLRVTVIAVQSIAAPPAVRRETFAALLPALRRSVEAALRVDAIDLRTLPLAAGIDTAPVGYAFLDGGGRLLEANALALEVFAAGDALTASTLGLRALRAGDDAGLQAALARVLRGGVPTTSIGLARFGSPRRYHLNLRALPRGGVFAPLQPAVAVVIRDPDYRPVVAADWLRQLFDLTPREAEMAGHLVRGRTPAEAASAMGVTLGSLRQSLHRVSRKLGVRDRCDLLLTLLAAAMWTERDEPLDLGG